MIIEKQAVEAVHNYIAAEYAEIVRKKKREADVRELAEMLEMVTRAVSTYQPSEPGEMSPIDYIRRAILRSLRVDGVRIPNSFDPQTGRRKRKGD